MGIQQAIETKLQDNLSPVALQVVNESHMHSVPPNSETHFKVVVVSPEFIGKRQVQRHQLIYQLLADEFSSGLHALALHTFSPEEWQGRSPESPQCLGGSKKS